MTHDVVLPVAEALTTAMKAFGWSLDERQPRQALDDPDRPKMVRVSLWGPPTKRFKPVRVAPTYVRLRFSRSLATPDLGSLRLLEEEFHNLPWASEQLNPGWCAFPAMLPFAMCSCMCAGFAKIGQASERSYQASLILVGIAALAAAGFTWAGRRHNGRIRAEQRASERRADAILAEARALSPSRAESRR